MAEKSIVAITGSNGFIGSSLLELFLNKGWKIKALQRNIPEGADNDENIEYINYSLNTSVDKEALKNVNLFVHCAYQAYNHKNKNAEEINLTGTKDLLNICRELNIKMVFLSTLSAHNEALSIYGKSKLEIENIFDFNKDFILKLGLVIGKKGGLFMNIAETIKKSKYIPLIAKGVQPIQTVNISDVFEIIIKSYENDISGNYKIAEEIAISMKDLYNAISDHYSFKRKFISLPYGFTYFMMKLIEAIGINLSVSSESLLGLKQLKAFDTEKDLNTFNIKLKTYEVSIEEVLSRNNIS